MALSPFKGGFLRNEWGHNGALTAILTALELQVRIRPRCSFILIVCPEVSLTEWVAKIKGRSMPVKTCKYLILRQAEYPITKLLEYDIVICTADFMTKRYADCLPYLHRQAADRAMVASGKDVPDTVLPRNYRRVYMPLHSRLYDPGQLDKNIAVLILDDSHRIGKTNSDLYQAIRQLRYHHALLITAGPKDGKSLDLTRQMGLLPGGGPFLGEGHMDLVLGTEGKSINERNRARKKLYERLVSALTV
ncbi:unnamed protein product [Clonostachys byssicola]|uniref:Helicase ATP-binding domain-containing protein n=1 Tax=Clonostachys byssicola TaxID=160290 RepID=A0A9N9UIP0_9HYPO|nr:unnamed protein product [Clonostachys byssicola]